jgi:ribonuclease BN (tRNA processing enzyme)
MVGSNGVPGSQYLTSFLINGRVAIDAGSVGLFGPPEQQSGIAHLFISHTHIDHIASLPIFLENTYEDTGRPLTIYGSRSVLECLRRDIFNGRVWPDLISIWAKSGTGVNLVTLEPGSAVEVDGLRVTAVEMNHVIPTCGFLVEDDESAIVLASDTGPTQEIWDRANAVKNLKAIFLETTFPDALDELADLAKHLTPRLLGLELEKLHNPVRTIVMHIKPRMYDQIIREIRALGLPQVEIGQPGKQYEF